MKESTSVPSDGRGYGKPASLMPGKISTSFARGSRQRPANSGGCAQMQLRGYHLGAAAALETRENADAAAAG
jgi:hypothetical protein